MAATVRSLPDGTLIAWAPQAGPQLALVTCPVFEVLYGGARYGGKTDGFLGDLAIHAAMYGPNAHGVFLRRRAKGLDQVVQRGLQIYGKIGARWVGGSVSSFIFPNGATLKIRHLWSAKDADLYQGHSYTRLYFEELTHWATPDAYLMMLATLRSPHGVPVGARASANPGGLGHEWVKARFVSPSPLGYKLLIDGETQTDRVFIPARIEDNPIGTHGDPNYKARLRATAPAHLRDAWMEGNWDIVPGGFFADVWNPDRHILSEATFNLNTMPMGWTYRRSFDWGWAKPASLGLWAISNGEQPKGCKVYFPKGSAIRIGEWYTCKRQPNGLPEPNVGLKLSNAALGKGVWERSKGRSWRGCVADPSMFVEAGGKSLINQMDEGAQAAAKAAGVKGGLLFSAADNSRIPGWALMHDMFEESGKERAESPGLWTTERCTDFIRTVPSLMSDEKEPDDIDTESEDHAGDESRYLCMSLGHKTRRVGIAGA